jgi:hypothetical protein
MIVVVYIDLAASMLDGMRRRVAAAMALLSLAIGLLVAPTVLAAVDIEAGEQVAALVAQARAFEHGEGVPRDVAQAIELYCAAAKLGDPEAQFSLGWIYANGRGVARDNALAALFFGIAAEQGHEYAKKMLQFVGPSTAEIPECMLDPPALADATADITDEDEFVATTPEQKQVAEIVQKLAPEYRVSPLFALAIIRAESNFDVNARSPKNAQGLMQLIPETSVRFNVKKPFDPIQNIRGGLAYLRWLLAYFEGDVSLVAAAYNAGEGTVEKYRGIPPYSETRAYVQRIKRYFRKSAHPYDATVVDPSPDLAQILRVRAH